MVGSLFALALPSMNWDIRQDFPTLVSPMMMSFRQIVQVDIAVEEGLTPRVELGSIKGVWL